MPKRAAGFTERPALSTPSSADRSPDSSLIGDDGIVATSHKGLVYPLGAYGPAEGELAELAPAVGWARIRIPGGLEHINIWALADRDAQGEGLAIVDTGMDIPLCHASWSALLAGPLAGKRITRVISTHLHPDHCGLAGWLCDRYGVALWMTRTEWMLARLHLVDKRDAPPPEVVAFWRGAGWEKAWIDAASAKGWARFATVMSELPSSYIRMVDGDVIRIGDREWHVVVGRGHTPEHACLWNPEGGLLISGDQVLPRVTSNVSLTYSEPAGDPLGDWLDSIERLKTLPGDLLVLPAHGAPFTGLHVRLDALADGHAAVWMIWRRSSRSRKRRWNVFRCCSAACWTMTTSASAPARRWRISGGSNWPASRGAAWMMG